MDTPTPESAAADGLTIEQSALVASAIFEPTVRRMTVLISSLISQTSSGDYALWAPLSALDHTIRDLKWESVPLPAAKQFAALTGVVLRKYSERAMAYLLALEVYGSTPVPHNLPFPTLQEWTSEDTIAAYDEVMKLYPAPADIPAPPPPPPAPTEDTTNG